jgi:DNA processing protein
VANRAESSPGPLLVVRPGDAAYPAAALELPDPPAQLFVRGRWPLSGTAVAIVGSRAATPYGLEVAARLGTDLARIGVTVVSGLAHGIDAAAHRAALAAGGATLAILPGGHDAIVPRGHVALAREIGIHGTVLSEHAGGLPGHPGAYLERNRLIAALARAVVVVEARQRSGALNTAAHARRLGRPVLAVPGDVDRETSRGCHALLRGGARVCENLSDILAACADGEGGAIGGAERDSGRDRTRERERTAGQDAARASGGTAPPPAAGGANDAAAVTSAGGANDAAAVSARLIGLLSQGPRSAEACACELGAPLAHVQAALLELEWAGVVAAAPGARWMRRDGGR